MNNGAREEQERKQEWWREQFLVDVAVLRTFGMTRATQNIASTTRSKISGVESSCGYICGSLYLYTIPTIYIQYYFIKHSVVQNYSERETKYSQSPKICWTVPRVNLGVAEGDPFRKIQKPSLVGVL